MGEPTYIHPRHRSLRPPLMVLAVFSLFVASWSLLSPSASAVNMQADQQCPPGGTVGQKCKDTTNGYTTNGHCTHIMVCKADSWPGSPRGCQPGMVVGKDCPYGKNPPPGKNPMPMPFPISTTSPASFPPSTVPNDIFNTASQTGNDADQPSVIVGSTSIQGIEYLITSDNEMLPVGAPLTPETPPSQRTFGPGVGTDVYNLDPNGYPRVSGGNRRNSVGGYVPVGGSFSGEPPGSYSSASGFGSGFLSGSADLVGRLIDGVMSLFVGGERPADQLIDMVTYPTMITPDISFYYRTQHFRNSGDSNFDWNSVVRGEGTFSSGPSISSLLRDAILHTARAGLDILTADFTAARNDFSVALDKTSIVIRRAGESVSSLFRNAASHWF